MTAGSTGNVVLDSGRGRLIAILVAYYAGLAYDIVVTGGPLVDLPFIVIALIATELVYRDAHRIGEYIGPKSVNATLWSLLTLIFGYLALPLYIFAERPGVLSEARALARFCPQCGSAVGTGAMFCSSCGVRLPTMSRRGISQWRRNYDVVLLAGIGVLGLLGVVRELVAPLQIPSQEFPQNASFPFSPEEILAAVFGATAVLGIAFIISAIVIYKRRKDRSSPQA